MEPTTLCQESTGLFVIRKCENASTKTCAKCDKKICNTHAFYGKDIYTNVDLKENYKKNNEILCISCFIEFDARLTNDIELYSKDRSVWRRKMIDRFHAEYSYMLFMAEDYGSLFDTTSTIFIHGDDHNDGSYFDS